MNDLAANPKIFFKCFQSDRCCLSPKFVCGCLLGVVKFLNELAANPKSFVSASRATDVRNYLIFIYCATNALRSSNIMEMTLKDLEEATKMPDDFPKGRVMKSNNYKTSFLYGVKAVCIAEEIYVYTLLYRDYLRPLLVQNEDPALPDHERYFFLDLILTTFCFSSFDPIFG